MSDAEAKVGLPLPEEYAAFVRSGGPSDGGSVLTLARALGYETLRLDIPFPFTTRNVTRILAARARGEDAFLEPEEPRIQNAYFGGNPGARAEKKRFDAVRKNFVMLG